MFFPRSTFIDHFKQQRSNVFLVFVNIIFDLLETADLLILRISNQSLVTKCILYELLYKLASPILPHVFLGLHPRLSYKKMTALSFFVNAV